jgi:hypothetical protein
VVGSHCNRVSAFYARVNQNNSDVINRLVAGGLNSPIVASFKGNVSATGTTLHEVLDNAEDFMKTINNNYRDTPPCPKTGSSLGRGHHYFLVWFYLLKNILTEIPLD